LAAIKNTLAWYPPSRSKPVFKFKLTELAARTNLEILESYNYDLQTILLEDAHSLLRPGSEFRPTAILDPVLQGHPLWSRAKKTLIHGAHLPVEPIEEEPRLQDLLEAIEFGNQKSATKDGPKLLSIFGREVEQGRVNTTDERIEVSCSNCNTKLTYSIVSTFISESFTS
jgi:hypothetical protein